ncbi:MAG: hypothetical protein WCA85_35550, partial [Paraburkholderia sp.]|uniref:hypothetical protein n=1 Tax=Paraburkholderia sp. TaxID=1926495 RepID=UPI003C5036E9
HQAEADAHQVVVEEGVSHRAVATAVAVVGAQAVVRRAVTAVSLRVVVAEEVSHRAVAVAVPDHRATITLVVVGRASRRADEGAACSR